MVCLHLDSGLSILSFHNFHHVGNKFPLDKNSSLGLISLVQSVWSKPFMSWMFHPKVSLLSLQNRNSFFSSISCKLAAIITGREDGGLIKTYLKLEGGSLIEGFSFGTLHHSNLSQKGGPGPCWEWRNVSIFSTSGFNSQSRSSLVRTLSRGSRMM